MQAKPTCPQLVSESGNRESCGKKGICCKKKNTLGCMAGLTLTPTGLLVDISEKRE